MAYNEAETRFYLIDPALRSKGYNEYWKLKLETPAPVEPFPFPDFPTHDALTSRYAKDIGVDITKPEATMLFMADSAAYTKPRYYQDAAIEAQLADIGLLPSRLLAAAFGEA